MGRLLAEIKPSDPSFKNKRQIGRGSIHITAVSNGVSKLVVFGAVVDTAGDTGLVLEGKEKDGEWIAEDSAGNARISPEGIITGGWAVDSFQFKLRGRITESTCYLTMTVINLFETKGGLPKGSEVEFKYDLSRDKPIDKDGKRSPIASTKNKGKPDRDCNIRWEMRNIWTPGGGLQMIQVPVCR